MSEMDHSNAPSSQAANEARRSDAEQAKLVATLKDLCDNRITFNQVVGMNLMPLESEERIEIRFDMKDELVGHFLHGRLHGGVIASALDVAGGMAVMWSIANKWPAEDTMTVLQRFATLGTIDIRVDFLRQGIGKHFIASAETLRLGRRIGSTSMKLENDEGTLIAVGSGAYIV